MSRQSAFTPKTIQVVRQGRWMATVSISSSVATPAVSEKVEMTAATSASWTGQQPAEPEREAECHPGVEVEREQAWRDRVVLSVVVQQEAAEHREDEGQGVHDPVARAAPGTACAAGVGTGHKSNLASSGRLRGSHGPSGYRRRAESRLWSG